ncbi:MAG: hypothetical protein ABIL00_02870 [candidate division WOR-3 bacterium]
MILFLSFFFLYSDTICPPDSLSQITLQDKWFGEDKFWHFGMSLALVGSSYHLLKCRLKEEKSIATSFSLGGTFSLGILKELWDRKKPKGYFSYRDLLYNLLGIGIGYFLFIYD